MPNKINQSQFMLYSHLFPPALKTSPKDAEAISHRLLWQGGFIDQPLGAGLYTILPLGWRVMTKIMAIIREEMNNIGGQELFMPSLQPKELWLRSDRWDHMDPPLFKLKDRHDKDYCLASTHEEVITDLAGRFIQSYKDLPLALYQIQNKFRNEMRFSGGLLRVREFLMKDMYSIHQDEKDLDKFYWQVAESYQRIFSRCGLKTKIVEATSGSIGGNFCHEVATLCPTGEDRLLCCQKCDWTENQEKIKIENLKIDKCPKCEGEIKEERAIEIGHIFKLDTKYTKSLNVHFTDANGEKKLEFMGCYGIGIGRLMAAIVEANHDDFGIIWPQEVAPFRAQLIKLVQFDQLVPIKSGLDKFVCSPEILVDDREDVSAGEKFMTADLLGCPWRIVISEKSLKAGGAEIKKRGEKETEIIPLEKVMEKIKI